MSSFALIARLRRLGSGPRAWPQVAVKALGPFEVAIDGRTTWRLGGEHVGSLQARALLGLLFDRGPRGADKDEVIDLLWPETDLDRADVNFHRTLGGVRRALAPSRPRDAIVFHAGRYRLAGDLVAWSDVAEFERLVEQGGSATPHERVHALERAVALYRGDYLDDCPYFGDSAAVQERRLELRSLLRAASAELSAAYRERGLRSLAALRAIQAQRTSGPDSRWNANGGWRSGA